MQDTLSDSPGRIDKRRSNKLEVIAELKVNTETWVSEKIESAMLKDNMLPLLKTREYFFLTFPVKF